jgi:hypothetical protein
VPIAGGHVGVNYVRDPRGSSPSRVIEAQRQQEEERNRRKAGIGQDDSTSSTVDTDQLMHDIVNYCYESTDDGDDDEGAIMNGGGGNNNNSSAVVGGGGPEDYDTLMQMATSIIDDGPYRARRRRRRNEPPQTTTVRTKGSITSPQKGAARLLSSLIKKNKEVHQVAQAFAFRVTLQKWKDTILHIVFHSWLRFIYERRKNDNLKVGYNQKLRREERFTLLRIVADWKNIVLANKVERQRQTIDQLQREFETLQGERLALEASVDISARGNYTLLVESEGRYAEAQKVIAGLEDEIKTKVSLKNNLSAEIYCLKANDLIERVHDDVFKRAIDFTKIFFRLEEVGSKLHIMCTLPYMMDLSLLFQLPPSYSASSSTSLVGIGASIEDFEEERPTHDNSNSRLRGRLRLQSNTSHGGSTSIDYSTIKVDDILIRWIYFHAERVGYQMIQRILQVGSYINNFEIYDVLIRSLEGEQRQEIIEEREPVVMTTADTNNSTNYGDDDLDTTQRIRRKTQQQQKKKKQTKKKATVGTNKKIKKKRRATKTKSNNSGHGGENNVVAQSSVKYAPFVPNTDRHLIVSNIKEFLLKRRRDIDDDDDDDEDTLATEESRFQWIQDYITEDNIASQSEGIHKVILSMLYLKYPGLERENNNNEMIAGLQDGLEEMVCKLNRFVESESYALEAKERYKCAEQVIATLVTKSIVLIGRDLNIKRHERDINFAIYKRWVVAWQAFLTKLDDTEFRALMEFNKALEMSKAYSDSNKRILYEAMEAMAKVSKAKSDGENAALIDQLRTELQEQTDTANRLMRTRMMRQRKESSFATMGGGRLSVTELWKGIGK